MKQAPLRDFIARQIRRASRLCLFFFAIIIPLISFAQGKYPVDAWEVWRSPVKINRFVVSPTEVYVTAENGVWVWDRLNEKWEIPYTTIQGFSEAYNLTGIRNLQWNSDQTLVVTTAKDMFTCDALWHYWTRTPLMKPLPPDSTNTRNFDYIPADQLPRSSDFSTWLAPRDWNIYRDGRALYLDDIWLRVSNVMLDDRSFLWAAINGTGVARGNDYTKKWVFEQLGPSESTIRCIVRNSAGWTVGGARTGLSFFTEANRTWSWSKQFGRRFQLSDREIRDIALVGDTYYLATDIGVLSGTTSDTYWKLNDDFRSNHIYSVCAYSSGVAVGTDRGIELLASNGSVNRIYEDPKHPLRSNQIISDGDTIYCATTIGILKILPQSGSYSFLDGPPGIASDDWSTIAITPNELWVGGRDGVAALDRRSQKWVSWLSTSYFNKGWSVSIAPTDSTVWVGCDNGLYRIDRDPAGRSENDPSAKASPRVHRYTTSDGLPSLELNQIILDGNRLVMATEGGFCIFRYLHEGHILE